MTGWQEVTVFELADSKRDSFNDGDWIEAPHITTSGNRLLQTGNIGVGRLLNRGTKRYVSDASFRALKCKELVPGDVLICRLAEPAGRACVVPDIGERRMLTSVDVTIFRPNPSKADRRFLVAIFSTPEWFQDVTERCGGSTRTRIARSELGKIKLRLPSIKAQTRIADALTDADDVIAALERMISKKQAIKQGMSQQLLTGKTRLPGFVSRWSRSTVGEVSEVKTGPFGSALHESDYVSRGTPIITVEHLGERGVEADRVPLVSDADRHRLRAYILQAGDVVFSRVGSIDRSALVSDKEAGWLFSGRLLRVRFNPSRADPAFMSMQFHARPFREAVRSVAVGQTMPSLNTGILRGIELDLPPIEEQRKIGSVLSDVDDELDCLEVRLKKARALKRGMMQQLLTGRTHLAASKGTL